MNEDETKKLFTVCFVPAVPDAESAASVLQSLASNLEFEFELSSKSITDSIMATFTIHTPRTDYYLLARMFSLSVQSYVSQYATSKFPSSTQIAVGTAYNIDQIPRT
jgi:hypothetical protein